MHRAAAIILIAVHALLPLTAAASDDASPKTAAGAGAESPDPYADETPEQCDARMKWWREARFGMFIHWGVYSVPAGTYKDKRIGGIGEWIMLRGRIPVAEYRAFARQFNPVKYDPEAWVRLARQAGMKYIIITSKHHDGFALFDSKVTDWDVVDATPYGKDLLRPLVDEAKKQGLRIGFYYSQAQDWNHPGGAKAGFREGDGWDEAHKGDFDAYLKTIARPQVEEILRGYDIDVLWWDTPTWMSTRRAARLLPLIRLRPGIITNNRLGGGFRGDTETPEQHIPATGYPDGRDWETCMTMNNTWGYKSYDDNWKSTQTLIRNLIDIASKGGNYLLNVGPTAEGEIPRPSIERLRQMGQWMDVNGEAIYGTTASPFRRLTWGRCTRKSHEGGTTLYLHVFDWPADGRLLVPGLRNSQITARLLDGGAAIECARTDEGVMLALPENAPDPIASVIVLEVSGQLDITAQTIRQAADGVITLGAAMADIHNRGYAAHARLETIDGRPNIGYWTDPRVRVTWTFRVTAPGQFEISATTAAPNGGTRLSVAVADQSLKTTIPATGDFTKFSEQTLGRVSLASTGQHRPVTLTIIPDRKRWQPINLRTITLNPVQPDAETDRSKKGGE